MYKEDDLKVISKIRKDLKDKYANRRALRSQLYHHGAYLKFRITPLILFVPIFLEKYFLGTLGFSLLISSLPAYRYWMNKTKLCKELEHKADELRLEIVILEKELQKNYSLAYESYENFLYNPSNKRRFSVRNNVFFDDINRDVTLREIDEDWL